MLSSRMMSAPASTACFTWSTVSASTSILRFGYLDQVKQAVEAGADIILLDKDRKSTRLNSSHRCTSYAVFCFKKKILNTSALHLPPTSHISHASGQAQPDHHCQHPRQREQGACKLAGCWRRPCALAERRGEY